MSEPKPLASLSPTLLARKGAAKPAMRPQVHYPDSLARTIIEEDLGWNDMGDDAGAASVVVPPVPDPVGEVVPITGEVVLPVGPAKPAVVQQQEKIAAKVADVAAANVVRPRRSALEAGRRAAFTLRVDAERHLKLRLACTIRNRSAQQLVTEALDRLIDELPDLATLAAQVAERR